MKNILNEVQSHLVSVTDAELAAKLQEVIANLQKQKLNILFVGPTGVGKSSTINAIFKTEKAKVGHNPYPETNTITEYEIDNLVLWDSPGFGDSIISDQQYAQQINHLLRTKDDLGNLIIDAVVVILDASSRDMGTAYEIINNVILPALDYQTEHLFIALNQCDMALNGKHWINNTPDTTLMARLGDKVVSIQERIFKSTNIHVKLPIYFSALYRYNISKFLFHLLINLPSTKRYIIADNINDNPQMWENNDSAQDYNEDIKTEIKWSMQKALEASLKGAQIGAEIGKIIPVLGPAVGAAIGGVLGFLGSFF